jgi:6-pyruvoyltetrahydropterin/6-carboxytetrahydropterin synthase
MGNCGNLHGHSYVFQFHCTNNNLDDLGMVVDFAVIKSTLCKWLDDNYDHRMILWENDPLAHELVKFDPSVVIVPYNPTAENIAQHLLMVVAPEILQGTKIQLTKVTIRETAKCSAICEV